MSSPTTPGVKPGAPATLVWGTVVAGCLGGLLLVGAPPGINWLLVAGAVGVVVCWAWRGDLTGHQLTYGALSLALVTTTIISSAEWLIVPSLIAALAMGSYAVAPGRVWSEVLLGLSAVAWRLPGAVAWLMRARGDVTERRLGKAIPVLRGVALGTGLLLVFGTLFVSADRAFAQLAENALALADVDVQLPGRVVVAATVALLALSLASFSPSMNLGRGGPVQWVGDAAMGRTGRDRGRPARTEWITALAMLDALFFVFVAVQIAVLFGGRDHVLETAGLTYAEYARSGFFQLVAVAFLTLAVLGLSNRFIGRESSQDHIVLKVLGGTLIALTLVVLASALKRLLLYEEVFGFTRLRLSVHAVIVWLALVFAIIAVSGVFDIGRLVPRILVATSALVLLGFALLRPDALIASRNVARFERTGKIDLGYLRSLSADAVPALVRLPEPQRSCALASLRVELAAGEPPWSFNASRDEAREILTEVRAASPMDCHYR